MRKIYFTVGPSQSFPTLSKHVSAAVKDEIPSLNHRGKEFKNLFGDTVAKLGKLLKIPSTHQVFFVSSALESMERSVQSTVEISSYHVITGSFGKSWMQIAEQLGKNVYKAPGVDVGHLIVPKDVELICITHNDTSTGIEIPMSDIYTLKRKYPKKLIALDIVSSVPYVDIDFSLIDIAFFSVQKGFGLPAGLGVLIVGDKALEKTNQLYKKGISIGSFHSFKNLSEKAVDNQTPETPNVFNIYLFNKVLTDMLKQGIQNIRTETLKKAGIMYDFFDGHKTYTPAVSELDLRSKTTLVINTAGDTAKIRKLLSQKGFEIGAGYGEHKEDQMRIANFPSHSVSEVKKLLANFQKRSNSKNNPK